MCAQCISLAVFDSRVCVHLAASVVLKGTLNSYIQKTLISELEPNQYFPSELSIFMKFCAWNISVKRTSFSPSNFILCGNFVVVYFSGKNVLELWYGSVRQWRTQEGVKSPIGSVKKPLLREPRMRAWSVVCFWSRHIKHLTDCTLQEVCSFFCSNFILWFAWSKEYCVSVLIN